MNKLKIVCVLGFVAFGIGVLFIDNQLLRVVESNAGGPPPGVSGAPGENTCTQCHTQNAGPGTFTITAPANYVPGQTYQMTVQHTTTDATRLRWGFQMTALDATNSAAGTFTDTSVFTQTDFGSLRFYVEHTQSGTFAGTSSGATWTFDWTAPATDVGPVTFYAAGNQANNNGGRTGDQIYTATSVTQVAGTPTPTNTPTDTPTNTPTATPTVAISGTVTYGNAIGSPNPRFVSNVLLSGEGSPNVSATTDFPGGNYLLTGFGSGSYTVTLTKTGGQNGITSFDAARIAQHVAGAVLLTGNQLIVADTSDNGSISSFDAATLASYVIHSPPYGVTGDWRFLPANRSYASASSVSGEDYTALLMGEVTGNWTNSAARPAKMNGPERPMTVKLLDAVAQADKQIVIPVDVAGIATKGVISYEFELRYDPAVIQAQKDAVDVAETVSRGLAVMVNAEEAGLLRVAVYGVIPIEAPTDRNGVLLNLRFTAVGAPGSVSPLTWERLMFNEGELRVSTVDGKVELF